SDVQHAPADGGPDRPARGHGGGPPMTGAGGPGGGGPSATQPAARFAPPALSRRQAVGILAGLGAFAVGFAAAGVLVLLHQGGSPAYWCLGSLRFLGIGAVGIASPRTLADAGRPAVGSRAGLKA